MRRGIVLLFLLTGCAWHDRSNLAGERDAKARRAADAALTQQMPAIDAAVAKHRYVDALEQLAKIDHPRARAKAEQVRGTAAADFRARAAQAQTPSRKLMLARIAHAFGGPEVTPQWVFDAESPYTIAWTVDTSHVSCPNAVARIGKAYPPVVTGTAGTPATLKVEASCSSTNRTFETTETYTYYVSETYTENEAQTRQVPTTTYVPGTTQCHSVPSTSYNGTSSYTTYSQQCNTTPGSTRTDYHSETTYNLVTKTRQVPRLGTRIVQHVEWTTRTDGHARVAIEKEAADGALTNASVVEAETAATTETMAVDALMEKLRAVIESAQQKRAAPLLWKAENAARLKLGDDAEEWWMAATTEIGKVPPAFAKHLDSVLGIPASHADEMVRNGVLSWSDARPRSP